MRFLFFGEVKEGAGGGGGGACEIFEGNLLQFSDEFCGMNQKRRLVDFLLSHRRWRHIRTIRFNHQSFGRRRFGRQPGSLGAFEGDDAGEG